MDKETEARFWAKVAKTDGCWEWTGARTSPGWHGRMMVNRRCITASRISWEMAYGPIPPGLYVLHACDNPGCVNPKHLMLGTIQANMVDAGRKARLGTGKNNTHCRHGHEFTPENTYRAPKTGRRQCMTCRTIVSLSRRTTDGNRKSTHCKRGHSMEDAYVNPNSGVRACRPCKLAYAAEYHRRRKSRAA
jgi:hypothetical protein